jgi:hypothetical protein
MLDTWIFDIGLLLSRIPALVFRPPSPLSPATEQERRLVQRLGKDMTEKCLKE